MDHPHWQVCLMITLSHGRELVNEIVHLLNISGLHLTMQAPHAGVFGHVGWAHSAPTP